MTFQGKRRANVRAALLVTSVLGGLGFASPLLAASAPILPTGGNVVSGTASIATSGSTLTIDQSTSKAIINWSSFSIGQGAKVQIDNGAGATLNRVTGLSPSQINGLLSATGSVYILNANGVIIGKTGVVNTGGTFVASTLDLTDGNFLAGGPLSFTGPSTASVVNLGKVGSLGGNVALIAQSVTNAGTITAANGTIGLASGSLITLMDDTADDGGLIKVEIGEAGDSLTNEGALAAAAVELRAQQGNIYALAGNTSGVIDATGVAKKGGQIFLTNPGGATTVTGTLEAQGAGGTPGAIETSGETLDIGSAIVNAHGGAWLLDPDSLTIDATAAATINAALGADTSVVESTASKAKASSASAGGTGDITVAAALSWSTSASLTLDSYNSIFINAPITVSGAGGVILVTDDTGGKQKQAGKGGDPNGGLYFGAGASLDFTSEASNPTLTINGNAYTLLYNLAQPGSTGPDGGTDDIAGIDNAGDDGYYALATNLTAPTGVTFGSALAGAGGNVFSGVFEGLGHTITGLTINDSNNSNVGLFGTSSGVIRDIGLIGVSVGASRGGGGYYGSYGSSVGGLVGQQLARGSITGAYVTGTVFGGSYTAPYPILGGLVGDNYGSVTGSWSSVSMTSGFVSGGLVGINESRATISQSYATGAISGTNDTGGLAGRNFGAIDQSYATGAVTVYTRPGSGGGLVGYDGGGGAPGGQITNSYATGSVTGVGYIGGIFGYASSDGDPLIANSFATGAVHSSTGEAGGLAGHTEGTITASFWDTQTTGAANAVSDNSGTVSATGLTTAQFQDGASASGLGSAFALGPGLYPYLTSLFPNGVQAISGFAYSDVGANGLADQTVSLIAGGVATGSATTGANGYYYLTLQAGTVTPGEALLAYAPSVNSATLGLASGTVASTGALPGLSLYGQTVTVPTASTTLSGAPTMSQAQALAIAADDAAGDATPTIQAATGLGLVATGASFTVDTPVSTATNLVIATPADIPLIVSGAMTATGGAGIGLLSGGALTLNAPIAINGAGSAVLTFGTEGMTFAPGVALSFNNADGTAATAPVSGQALAINGQAYSLLYTLANSGSTGPDSGAYDIAGIDNAGDGGYYALATNLIAPSGVTFTSALAGAGGNTFSGVFEGLGHTITGLTINAASARNVGLIGTLSGGVVRDLDLVGGSITGGNYVGALAGFAGNSTISNVSAEVVVNGGDRVGGLVGEFDNGSITNAQTRGTVSGFASVGGLIGALRNASVTSVQASGVVNGVVEAGGLVGAAYGGAITNAMATGAVNGYEFTGGLVGLNYGSITNAVASGPVSSNYVVGGLVGQNSGSIVNSLATGRVTGSSYVGGLVGNGYGSGGSVNSSYWDTQTTGQRNGFGYGGGGAYGLTTAQLQNGGVGGLGSAFSGGTGGLYPYLTALFPKGVQAISGFAYSDVGATPLAGQTVSLIAGGAAAGAATTGANGYYYMAFQAGTLTTSEPLLAYAPAAASATLGATSATAVTGLSLYGQTVTVPTASTTLSGAPTLAQAQALAIAADDAAGDATPTIQAATGLGLVASGASFTVDRAVSTATNLVIATPEDIPLIVSGAMTATGGAGIGLLSGGALTLNAPIAINGAGSAVLTFGTEGMTFAPGVALSFNNADGTAATAPVSGQALAINGQAYTLLYTLANSGSTGPDSGAYDIAGIDNAGDGGYYALATNLTAPSGVTFGSALAGAGGNTFSGVFEGLGHTITGLTINAGSTDEVGLIGNLGVSGIVRDINLAGGSVTGGQDVGALVGESSGLITNARVGVAITGNSYGANSNATDAGGLVGFNKGVITNSIATGAVKGVASEVGGLVGNNNLGSLVDVMATGSVTGEFNVGGLVGSTAGGAITDAVATGAVSGQFTVGGLVGTSYHTVVSSALATGGVAASNTPAGPYGNVVGGLIGNDVGTVSNSYWDVQTTGQSHAFGYGSGGATGLTTAQFQSGSATGLGSTFSGGTGGLYPYLTVFFPNGVQAIRGFAYSDVGATPLVDQAVSLIAGGVAAGSATTGANGYYYLTLPAGTVTPGESLLAYAPSANSATLGAASATVASTGALPGLSLYGQTVTVPTASTTLSGAPSLTGAQAVAIAADDAAGDATPTIRAATGLGLVATGASFTVDTPVSTATNLVIATPEDIPLIVSGAMTATGGAGIGLLSGGALTLNAPIAINGAGSAVLTFGTEGMTFAPGVALSFNNADGTAATAPVSGQALAINGQAYTLLYTLANSGSTGPDSGAYDIAGIDNAGDGGYYALATNLTAPSGVTFTSALAGAGSSTFTGVFDGLGHTISGLTVNDGSASDNVGLIGASSGVVRDLGVVGGSVTGGNNAYVGALVGVNNAGIVEDSFSSGAVSGGNAGGLVGENKGQIFSSDSSTVVTGEGNAGGLVGQNIGTITGSYATGNVTGAFADANGFGGGQEGGLVGSNAGTVTLSYATGAVTGGGNGGGLAGINNYGGIISLSFATGAVSGNSYYGYGGLVGTNEGPISQSYATGSVTGTSGSVSLGGVVGANYAQISHSYSTGLIVGTGLSGGALGYESPNATTNALYWDTQTSGRQSGAAGTGLTTAQLQAGGASGLGSSFSGGANGLYPYLTALFPNGVQALVGSATAGSQVGIYANGGMLGGGTVSAGANGYVYLAVPAGTFAASGNKVGESGTPSGRAAPSALAYADNLAVQGQTLTVPALTSGAVSETTAEATYSALQTDLGATFGAANRASLTSSLATAPVVIQATSTSGFTVDQAVNAGGAFSLVASGGGVTLSQTITAGGAILIAADGAFANAAGAGALTPGSGANFTVYSQVAGNVTGSLPTDSLGGLTGVNWYNDAYSFGADAFASAVPGGGNHFVYGYAATLIPTLGGSVSKTYDGTTTAATGSLTLSVPPLVDAGGLSDGVALSSTGAAYGSANAGTGLTVTASGIALTSDPNNYTLATTTAAAAIGTINPAPLTITAANASKVYGTVANLGTTAFTESGLVAGTGDGVTGVTLTSAGTVATATVLGGPYAITPSAAQGSGLGNYTITYDNAPTGLTVTPAALTITASNQSKVYGTVANLGTTAFTETGLVNSDTVTGVTLASAGTVATATVLGGPYAITASNAAGSGLSNYSITYDNAPTGLTVTPAALTITASNQTKVYGTTPNLGTTAFTDSGLLNTDSVTGVTLTSAGVVATASVAGGPYAITPSAASGSGLTNYSITYLNAGTGLTVTPATLTASLTGTVSKTYNDGTAATLTAGNYSLSGVVNGDTVSLNDPTSGTYSTPHAGTGETVSVTGLALTNNTAGDYVLANGAASAAIGTIAPEAITVTASANSKVYNGTLVAAATPTVTTGTLYAGDGTLAETYASKDVGSTIALTPTASLTTPGDYSVTYVSTNNGVITPASLTATVVGNVSKVYDSNVVAPLTGANIALAGVVAGDSVSATNPSAGQYATANVGTGILVGATGFSLTGASAKDYTVANAFAFGNVGTITPEPITITASANTKVYNGTLVAAATPTVTSGTLYSGDGTLSETYASKDVGSAITLTPAVALVDPADYKVTLAATNTGVITPASLTATVVGNVTKVYDSNNVAPLTGANIALAGVVAGDSVSATNPSAGQYATVNVGSGILVGATGFSLTGASAKDYTVANAFAFGNVGTITPEPITVTATANSKVYNGTTAAAATPTVTKGTLYAGDGTLSETYASKNVGSAITLTPAVALVDPADYTVTLASANTGVITPATLNVSLTGTVSKVYNGTTVATLSAGNYSLTGVIGSDQVSVANTSGTYATKNVAYAIPVTVSGLTLAGAQAQDYVVNVTSVTASIGTITPDIIQTTPTTFAAGDLQYLQLSAQAPGDYGLSETIGGTTISIITPTVSKYNN